MRFHDIARPILLERHGDIVEALTPYRDDPSIFITFSDLLKVGIKPNSYYDTPVGIYSYPLVEMWGHVVRNDIPFASERPYVHVLRSRGNVVDVSDYTADQLEQDIPRLKAFYDAAYARNGWTNLWEKDVAQWMKSAVPRSLVCAKMWNISRHIGEAMSPTRRGAEYAEGGMVSWNVILRRLGYQGFTDRLATGLIHRNELCQAVFLTRDAVEHVATLANVRRHQHELIDVDNIHELRNFILRPTFLLPAWAAHRTERIPYHVIREWSRLLATGQSPNFAIRDEATFFGDGFADKGFAAFYSTVLDQAYDLLPQQVAGAMTVAEKRPEIARTIANAVWSFSYIRGSDDRTKFARYAGVMLNPRVTSFIQAHFQYLYAPEMHVPIAVAAAQNVIQYAADLAPYRTGMALDEAVQGLRNVLAPYWGRLVAILGEAELEKEVRAHWRDLENQRTAVD